MSVLFETTKINGMELENRFVRSATFDGSALSSGHVSDLTMDILGALAGGGVGLIVMGIVCVDPRGQLSPRQAMLSDDSFLPGLERLTGAIHDRGGKIAAQLFHGGRESARFFQGTGTRALGPSESGDDPYFELTNQAMTEDDIFRAIEAFGRAALRAQRAGFDAVQVHAAHAYLPAQFLSPRTNRRQDRWGGDLGNRLRLHKEIYRAVRDRVGLDCPVLIKLGVADGFAGGLEFEEGLEAAIELADTGYDALEISQGLRGKDFGEMEFRTKVHLPGREAYFRDWCKRVKAAVDAPVTMIGGLRDFSMMEQIVNNGEADFVALSRPLIREPRLIAKWRSGSKERPACISCNKCLDNIRQKNPLECMVDKQQTGGRPPAKD